MRKHLYFHSSHLEFIRELADYELFERVFSYPHEEYKKIHRNECGRIKIQNLYIHFLVGQIQNDDCPWCGCSSVVVKKEEDKTAYTMNPFAKDKYWVECVNCKSRGPTTLITPIISCDELMKEHIMAVIKDRYSRRLSWDSTIKEEEND